MQQRSLAKFPIHGNFFGLLVNFKSVPSDFSSPRNQDHLWAAHACKVGSCLSEM